MALSENYRTETIGRSDCRPIVRLSADTIVRWDYHPNPNWNICKHCQFGGSKIQIKFFHQIDSAYKGGFRPHILQISWQHLLAFKNYKYFNYAQFSK